jgi:hypothetical protein
MALKITGVKEMQKNMDNATERVVGRIVVAMEMAKIEMENTAKDTAPWTDRTGNARNSITGSGVEKDKDVLKIGLAIGVDYGKYLELCHFGKYRIVWPTIEWMGNKLPSLIRI